MIYALVSMHLSAQSQDATHLSGIITDMDKGTYVTIGTLSDNEKKDSVLSADGTFDFAVNPKGGELYFLSYTMRHEYYGAVAYVQKGTHTHISAGKLRLTLSGCPLAGEQNLFYRQIHDLAKESPGIDSALRANPDSATKSQLQFKQKQIENELISFYTKWVLNHRQSPFSVAVIYLYLQDTNASLTKSLFNQLSAEAKENNTVTEVMPYLFARQEANEKLRVGDMIADFILQDTLGTQTSFYSLKGNNYVLLDVWASWCSPCRKSMPAIKELIAQYSHKNFKVVSLSADTERKLWTKAIREEGMNWTQLSDLKGTDSGFIHDNAIYEFPTYLIISPEGNILYKPYTIESVKEVLAKEFTQK